MYSTLTIFLISFARLSYGWSYKLPQYWHGTCGTGHSQSPIPLPEPFGLPMRGGIQKNYNPVPLKIVDDGKVVKMDLNNAGYVTVPNVGNKFYLTEAVFHTPSEHWIGQTRYDMEVQLVHKATSGDVLNIAVLCDFEEHATSHFLDEFIAPFIDLEAMPGPYPHVLTQEDQSWKVDMSDFWDTAMRGLLKYFNYEGSLTQPPCTENVQWVVSGNICLASRQWGFVMSQFQTMKGNSRSLQPENEREVFLETTSDSFQPITGSNTGRSTDDNKSTNAGYLIPILLLIPCCCCLAYAYLKSMQDKDTSVKYHEFDRERDVKMHESRPRNYSKASIGGGYIDYDNPYRDESTFHPNSSRYLSRPSYRDGSDISRPVQLSITRDKLDSERSHDNDSIRYDPPSSNSSARRKHFHMNQTAKHGNQYRPRQVQQYHSASSSSPRSQKRPEAHEPSPRNNMYRPTSPPTHERVLTGESEIYNPQRHENPNRNSYRGPQYRQFSHERYGPVGRDSDLGSFSSPLSATSRHSRTGYTQRS